MSRPRLVTDPERELRLLRYGAMGETRNAKLIVLGVVGLLLEAAATLALGASPLLGFALFAAGIVPTFLFFWLDRFLP